MKALYDLLIAVGVVALIGGALMAIPIIALFIGLGTAISIVYLVVKDTQQSKEKKP